MDPVEIVHLVSRLRRNFSRNADIMAACEELERLQQQLWEANKRQLLQRAEAVPASTLVAAIKGHIKRTGNPVPAKERMRQMRERRKHERP